MDGGVAVAGIGVERPQLLAGGGNCEVADGAMSPVVPGARDGEDGEGNSMARPVVVVAWSEVFLRGEEKRLEQRRRRRTPTTRTAAKISHTRFERVRTKEKKKMGWVSGLETFSDRRNKGIRRRNDALRHAISRAWGRDSKQNGRGMDEGGVGYM